MSLSRVFLFKAVQIPGQGLAFAESDRSAGRVSKLQREIGQAPRWPKETIAREVMGGKAQGTDYRKIRRATVLQRNIRAGFMNVCPP